MISAILILISSFSGQEVTPPESSSRCLCPDVHRDRLDGGEGVRKKKKKKNLYLGAAGPLKERIGPLCPGVISKNPRRAWF